MAFRLGGPSSSVARCSRSHLTRAPSVSCCQHSGSSRTVAPGLAAPRVIGLCARRASLQTRNVTAAAAVEEKEQEAEQEREEALEVVHQVLVEEVKVEQEKGYGWLAFWVASAASFGAGIWATQGADKAEEFFAGYILEQSLSVDNLFVFVLVFTYFKTPPAGQARVLSYGIATAAVLRAILIVAGVELVQLFEPMLLVFAAILLFSSYKLFTNSIGDDDSEDLSTNAVVQFCSKFINTTDSYDETNFFTTMADGAKAATPLLLTLAVVELSDVLFAVDSIPAVFGVTTDPFIVYSSNLFAILSLRAVYFFMASAMLQLKYLDKAVAVVLGFIGSKMVADVGGIHIDTTTSLLVVAAVLGIGVGASLLIPDKKAA